MLGDLAAFTGADWEQEDDITMVTLACHLPRVAAPELPATNPAADAAVAPEQDALQWSSDEPHQPPDRPVLAPQRTRRGAQRPAERWRRWLRDSWLTDGQAERLKTAVAEASMNAMEHGNGFRGDLPVDVEVSIWPDRLVVRITDLGEGAGGRTRSPTSRPSSRGARPGGGGACS